MAKVFIVARQEFMVILGRNSFRIFTALLPALGLIALVEVLIFQSVTEDREPEKATTGYVDEAGFFARFQEQGVVQVKKEQRGIHLDDEGYAALEGFLLDNLLSGQLPEDLLARSRSPVLLTTLEVDEAGNPVEEPFKFGRFFFFIALGMMVIMSVFATSGYLLQGLSEEKENRIMEVLLSSVTPDQLMLGKLLGLGAAGLAQVLVWVTSGGILFVLFQNTALDLPSVELPTPGLVALGLLYFLLGFAFFGALLGALGAVTTTQREAQQVTFIFILPGVAPLWLLTPILENPEGTLPRVLSFIPFTALVTAMVRLAMNAMGALDLVVSLGLLALGTALAVLLTLRLFRTYLLMYGRRPGVREILTTLARG